MYVHTNFKGILHFVNPSLDVTPEGRSEEREGQKGKAFTLWTRDPERPTL